MKTWYQKYNEQLAQSKVKAYRNDFDAMIRSLERKANPKVKHYKLISYSKENNELSTMST